jgi:hypothetical protein
MGNTALVVLLEEIRVPLVVCSNCDAFKDFIDPFTIYINANGCAVCVVFHDGLFPIVNAVGGGSVQRSLYASIQCVIGKRVDVAPASCRAHYRDCRASLEYSQSSAFLADPFRDATSLKPHLDKFGLEFRLDEVIILK